MISVSEALARAFALAPSMPMGFVPVEKAAGRVLIEPVKSMRDQPPFGASAMDGYAARSVDVAAGQSLQVIGQSAAGARFDGGVGPGQAVRIFTGAPVPDGADRVVIQEDVIADGSAITIGENIGDASHIRPVGCDFRAGATIAAPLRLGPSDVALLAAMNIALVPVSRQPEVALIASGDELVSPGQDPGEDQIIASNNVALAAITQSEGAIVRTLPIARDNVASIKLAFELASGADLIITSGGASVGDHDLIGPVAAELGMDQSFYKVAMRPGKPLMAGRLGAAMVFGLPGNPVSAIVCAEVFLRPILRAMQGLPAIAMARHHAKLGADLSENGPREHYMRAHVAPEGTIEAAERQDSALISVMRSANALLIRPPGDPARSVGATVEYLPV